MRDARRLLGATRVLTLAGPPGVGKTRLALHAAEQATPSFPDGVWFVDLAGLRDAGLVAHEVAGALDLHDASTRWAVEGLAAHIGDRNMLVVLDNCEHVSDACAVLVDSLTRTCPNLHVLATSRQSLSIRAETVLRVAPLSVPAEGSVDGDAVDLLLARAAAVLPDFRADQAQLRAAAELCRRLDGIPLAIELAAVRLKTLTIEQMLQRLDDRFTVLGGSHKPAPEHQRTLRAALDWSRDLTSEDERLLWRRLSVFPTSFNLGAVEAICSGGPLESHRVLDALDGLVDKSIITATRAGDTMRYRLLDSVREYGLEALVEAGEMPVLAARHGEYYSALCAQAWPHWLDEEQPAWFARLDAEHDNLRAALRSMFTRDAETGCVMAANMWLYWQARGHITEGRRKMATLLESLPTLSTVRAKALWVAGYLAVSQADVDAAMPLLEAAVEAGARAGDEESVAFATQYLGLCRLFSGDLPAAEDLLSRALQMHNRQGGRAAHFTLVDLAVTVMLAGDLDRAAGLYTDALAMTAHGGDPWTRAHALWGAGVASFLQGDLDKAERAEKDALRLVRDVDERSGTALCLETLAWISAAKEDLTRAATLQGASLSVWESIPGRLPAPLQEPARHCETRTRSGLGPVGQEQAFEAGRHLDRRDAVALALEESVPGPTSPISEREPSVLSQRENEVAALIAQGLTDRQIATRLVISQRTAESHVQHILTKLSYRSRAQIAAWVAHRQATI